MDGDETGNRGGREYPSSTHRLLLRHRSRVRNSPPESTMNGAMASSIRLYPCMDDDYGCIISESARRIGRETYTRYFTLYHAVCIEEGRIRTFLQSRNTLSHPVGI